NSMIDHRRNIVHLREGDGVARLGHELAHDFELRTPETKAGFEAARLALAGVDEAAAWRLYRDTRHQQEMDGRSIESRMPYELAGRRESANLSHESTTSRGGRKPVAEASQDGLPNSYEQLWREEFARFKQSGGTFRPLTDYALPIDRLETISAYLRQSDAKNA